MAIVFTFKSAQFSTSASTVYTGTTNWTPQANALQLLFVNGGSSTSLIDPSTVTGHGLTWTKISGTNLTFAGIHTSSVWVAKTSASAATSGAASANWSSSRTGGSVIQFEVTGIDLTVGSTATVAEIVTSTGTGTAGTATLSAATRSTNLPIAFYIHAANEGTTPKSGWTETAGADGNFNTPATGAEAQFQASAYETGSSATWSTSAAWRSFALQILGQLQTFNYTVLTKDIDLGSTATVTKTLVRSGSGGVLLGGSASHASQYTYIPITQDLIASPNGSVRTTKKPPVATRDIRVSGAGTYQFQAFTGHVYSGTGGVIVAGASTQAIEYVYVPITFVAPGVGAQRHRLTVAGTATQAVIKTWLAAAAGVILAGSATTAQSHQFTYTTSGGVIVAGASTRVLENVYAPITQDVLLAGSATAEKEKVYVVGVAEHSELAIDDSLVLRFNAATRYRLGQGISSDAGVEIYLVQARLSRVGSPAGNVWIELWSSVANVPTILLASTSTIDVSTIGTSVAWMAFGFKAGQALTAGTAYFLFVNADYALSATNYLRVYGSGATAKNGYRTNVEPYREYSDSAGDPIPVFASIAGADMFVRTYASRSDLKLSGTAAAQFIQAGATFTYTGTGGVILAGSATKAIEYVYAPITADIRVAGSAAVATTKAYAATGGVIVAGSGSRVLENVYVPIKQDIKLSGTRTLAIEYVYIPITSSPATTLLSGNVHAWHFDEASGSTRNDSIGTNHLTDNNTVGVAVGKSGNAAQFVTANHTYLNGTGVDTSGDYHIDFWYRPEGAGTFFLWLNKNTQTYLFDNHASLDPLGTLSFNQQKNSGGIGTLTHETKLGPDTWYLIEAEMSGGNMYLWVNGVAALNNGQALGGTQTATDGGEGINFGAYSFGATTTGRIDEPGFWSRAFTAQEHIDRYNGGAGFFYPFVTQNLNVKGSGTYQFQIQRTYTGTGGVIVAGASIKAIEYVYAPITQDVLVAGGATVTKTKAYTATGGVIVAGSASRVVEYVYAVQTQDIKLDSQGTYQFVGAASHTYTGTGGVIVAGAATRVLEQVYAPITQDILLAGAAARVLERVRYAQTQNIIVSGSATTAQAFSYDVQTQDIRVAGTANRAIVKAPSVVTQDIRVSGSATRAIEYTYSAQTQDIVVTGRASVTFEQVYAPVTADIIVAGSATWTKTLVRSATTTDIKVDSAGTYQFISGAAFVYYASGGVVVAGRATLAVEYVYSPITADIHLSGSGSVAFEQAYAVISADVKVGGAASLAFVKTYSTHTQDVIVAGAASVARVRTYAAITQAIVVAGAGSWSRTIAPSVATRDIRFAGAGTVAFEQAYPTITADIIISGRSTQVVIKIGRVVAQDILVAGGGTYAFQATGTSVYTGTGGVIVGGSYWTFGQRIIFCRVRLAVPQFSSVALSVPALVGMAFAVALQDGPSATVGQLDDIFFAVPALGSVQFDGAESCEEEAA